MIKLPDYSIDDIFFHIANGGSLTDYCKARAFKYSTVVKWINSDKARLEMHQQAEDARREWAVERVMDEIRAIGLSDLRDLYAADGTIRPSTEWSNGLAKIIAGVEVYEEFAGGGTDRYKVGETKKVKLWDKPKALEMIAKNLGQLIEKSEVVHKNQVINLNFPSVCEICKEKIGNQSQGIPSRISSSN